MAASPAAGVALPPPCPIQWLKFAIRYDKRGERHRGREWYQAVAPAAVALLALAHDLFAPAHPRATLTSPTAESIARALTVLGQADKATELRARWKVHFAGDAEAAATVDRLLHEAAHELAYCSFDMFDDYKLTGEARSQIEADFAELPAFASALCRVFDLAQGAARAAGRAEAHGITPVAGAEGLGSRAEPAKAKIACREA